LKHVEDSKKLKKEIINAEKEHFVGLYFMMVCLASPSLTADCAVLRRISGRL